uniref:Plexin cytoplasmic RasGAP domain-containing protein n=1 Tax=Tetraodon nigroviridis TaxID=99883 RepID=H3BZJ1_TETNG
VPDGAALKVLSLKSHPRLSPQGSVRDDENFSGKYFHLIDADVDEAQIKNPERKKFELKEVHLTKLLSTKARGSGGSDLAALGREAEVALRPVLLF